MRRERKWAEKMFYKDLWQKDGEEVHMLPSKAEAAAILKVPEDS